MPNETSWPRAATIDARHKSRHRMPLRPRHCPRHYSFAIMKASVPGVYISYPFCAQKCTFCNFASGVFPRDLERTYMDALRREIWNCEFPWRPETVYLGGGTPSGMDPADLRALLDL